MNVVVRMKWDSPRLTARDRAEIGNRARPTFDRDPRPDMPAGSVRDHAAGLQQDAIDMTGVELRVRIFVVAARRGSLDPGKVGHDCGRLADGDSGSGIGAN